jgi:outer membrane protein assembly factor BamB
MSTDFDRMFAALGRDADAIPLAEAATARRRGEHRRRTRLVAAAVATACVLAAGLGGGSWLARGAAGPDPVAPPPTPDEVVQLGPPRPVGKELSFGGPVRFALTGIVGERAYAGWQREDGTLQVVAADLATGEAAWPVRTLGRFDDSNGIAVLPQALLAIAEHNDGTDPDQTAFVIDPQTGELRWELPFSINDDDLLCYDSALVLATGDGATRGYDWRTGDTLWEVPAPADPPVASLGAYSPSAPGITDDRLFQITAGGHLLERDAATGALRADRAGVGMGAEADYTADDGRLFAASREEPYRIRVSDLDRDGSRILYTGAAGHSFSALAPCGTGRICVADQAGEEAEVAALDIATGREVWRSPVPNWAERIVPNGARIVVVGNGPDGQTSTLYDVDGTELASAPSLEWLSTGTLLSIGDGELASVTAATGDRRTLGPLDATPAFCSWSDRHLVCPTQTALRIWTLHP